MTVIEQTSGIYEETRKILLSMEPVTNKIEKISNPKVREKLLEVCRTCQTDILILNDYLIGIMNCDTEEEIPSVL